MKRFHFRLQKLMDAKESEEKEKQRLFGEAQQLVIESEMELNSLEDALEQSIRERRTLQERKVSIAELMIHDKWKIHLQKKFGNNRQSSGNGWKLQRIDVRNW